MAGDDRRRNAGRRLAALIALAAASAAPLASVAGASSDEEELGLQTAATRDGWMALLHYRHLGGAAWRSEIASPGFFLDEEGRDEPEREWRAARRAFLQPMGADDERRGGHARCLFPARFAFMKAALGWREEALAPVECADLDAFEEKLGARSLAIVFASYFLSNPASTFGHAMIYVGSAPQIAPGAIRLTDTSIGFEADTKGLGPVGYIPKGLAGGLSAGFRVKPFYDLVRKYERQELRDLWLFPLRLQPEELAQLVRHTWELRSVSYQYGFFGENCAQKLLTLVHAVAPRYGLLPFSRAAVLPAEVVRRLIDKLGMSGAPILRRSLLGRYEEARGRLSAPQRAQLDELTSARRLPPGVDEAVLAAALLWSELQLPHRTFRRAAELRRPETVAGAADLRWRRALLEEQARRDGERGRAGGEAGWQTAERRSLLDGHAPSRLALRGGRRDGEAVAELGVRWLLHDPLDPPVGYPALSTLEVLHVDAGVSAGGDLFLREATAVRLEKLGRSSSLQSPLVWRIELGARRPALRGAPLHAGVEVAGGLGLARALSQAPDARGGLAAYALLGLRPGAELGSDGARFAPLALATAGALFRLGPLRARLEAESAADLRAPELGLALRATARLGLGQSWDAELAGALESQRDAAITLGVVLFR